MSAKDFRETVSSFKRAGIKLKVCPRCGSADVSILTLTGYVTQPIYACNSCGFRGNIFLEVSKEKEEEEIERAKTDGEGEERREG
ncbi:MAG: hypothetical protein FJZ49_07115 [Candidatus Verstraetearchaeota archaeon]|nr:hypothetical protein [Candidatus Verstraetearchaeota archaeon]